ncbi:MAG: DUF2330 domain-containing protein [Pseudomonadota bacterium]
MIRFFVLLSLLLIPNAAQAFCGFYVAKADTSLFNKASKVVMSRHDERTVMTMVNDFQGDVKDFAIVIPVPTVITRSQVNVTDGKIVDHLDAYTAPRLVEYFDEDPCAMRMLEDSVMLRSAMPQAAVMAEGVSNAKALGVTILEEYTVGEYDIMILDAKQSDGLLTWLEQEGYKLPGGADKVLKSYIKQDMKFFVTKVNLEEFEKSGFTNLRPLQVAYEHEKFMLPIRLGTLNADGDQELILFTLTKEGRVEPTNYRTVKIPTGNDVPLFVKDNFGEFYQAMFTEAVEKEDKKAVFLEYAWDMAWCDPCAADPLPNDDLRELGAWWVDSPDDEEIQPMPRAGRMIAPVPAPVNVFVTRMHVRYNAETFPEDIALQVTSDRQNFQGRYVMRHPFKGAVSCEAGKEYYKALPKRFETEAQSLASLTGWDVADIRNRMSEAGQDFDIKPKTDGRQWWERMWEDE